MTDSAALRTIQSTSVALIIATATIAVIGLSPDTAERYALAAHALDSLPAYPTARDTAISPPARDFATQVTRLDSLLVTLNPIQMHSGPDLSLLMRHHFASMSTSTDLVAGGIRIELAPDGTVPSRVRFLEALREVSQLAAPSMDLLAASLDARLDSLKAPTDSMTLDVARDPSDSTAAWMETGRVSVKALLHVEPDTLRPVSPALLARRDSFVVSVPVNPEYFGAVWQLSWRLSWYFEQQRWLMNRERRTGLRLSEMRRHIFLPMSPAALAPVDRIKPVLITLSDFELPTARKYLHEKAEALRERGSVTILGLTLENALAVVIAPLVFMSLALLLLFHLLHSGRDAVEAAAWAPAFPGTMGLVASAMLFLAYPVVASWLFGQRMYHAQQGVAGIAVVAIGVIANVRSFVEVRALVEHTSHREGITMPRRETTAAILVAILLATTVLAVLGGRLGHERAGMVVAALTALVVVWYTVETARLRRDAEARTQRDTQPVVRFEIANAERPDGIPQLLAHGATPANATYLLRFWLTNESANPGIARIRIRLALGDRVVMSGDDAYDGSRYWEIAPYFKLGGVFDVCPLVNAAIQAKRDQRWPSEDMTIAAQLDLYDLITRRLIWSASKEYFLKHRDGTFDFWPHISAQVMDLLPPLMVLPPRSQAGGQPRAVLRGTETTTPS